jgi:membrane AbrB-like protein
MLSSAALHGAGIVETRLPNWMLIVGMLLLGAMIGARFTNTGVRTVVRLVGAGIGSFLVSLLVAAAFVAALTALLALRVADAAVAFAPGALDAMMILALALHLDPVYVGAHHLARFLVASLALPILVRMFRSGDTGTPAQPAPKPLDSQD